MRPVRPGADLYESEIEALIWSNLEAFYGADLFPIARQPAISTGGRPDVLAIDEAGRVVLTPSGSPQPPAVRSFTNAPIFAIDSLASGTIHANIWNTCTCPFQASKVTSNPADRAAASNRVESSNNVS